MTAKAGPQKIGINGLGRIGRAVLRIALQKEGVEIVAINDINPDVGNLAYLIKYDSTYGRLPHSVTTEGDRIVIGNEKKIAVYRQENIDEVPWEKSGAEIVIDASGVSKNLQRAVRLKQKGVRHCVVTNSPPEDQVDRTIILGANHEELDVKRDFLISSSICDANAFAPVVRLLDRHFGIEHGFLTTLHPWLNYQNVLDGPSISYATPGQIHDHYALGRASTTSLIPKTTSAVNATCKALKKMKGKFLSMSYRVPTMIVSSADISVQLTEKCDAVKVREIFEVAERDQSWKIFYNNKEALVSADFTGSEYSAVVDHRWIMMNDQNYLKMILWYDNEWGYSSRVIDLIHLLQARGVE